ncbi:MAG: MarR family transcriptional regulator [Planctomycetota bacterium]|nr:MarR family transcriptional regulator [Planctomycetota bacterium]
MTIDLLRDLETRLALGLRADAARLELREATARVLLALSPSETLAMSSVAQRVGRDPSTATRFVDRAVADDLLVRMPGAEDRRRRVVSLTERGGELRERLVELRERRARLLLDSILTETGLGEGQVEWFLQAFVQGLRA